MKTFLIDKINLTLTKADVSPVADPKSLDGDDYAFRKTELEATEFLIDLIDKRKDALAEQVAALAFQRVGLNKRRIELEARKGAK